MHRRRIFTLKVAPRDLQRPDRPGGADRQSKATLNCSAIKSSSSAATTPASSAGPLFQLKTILEENHHSFLIVEHDPLLYEDFQEMVGYLAQALKQASREATVLLHAPALDPHLQEMAELSDRVFCIYNEPAAAKGRGKAEARTTEKQRTLEAYS